MAVMEGLPVDRDDGASHLRARRGKRTCGEKGMNDETEDWVGPSKTDLQFTTAEKADAERSA